MAKNEHKDYKDEKGNLTGQKKPRDEVHRDGDWHKTVQVWIMNLEGELLIQKRAPGKEIGSDKWDISVAGHVEAGDDSINAGVREVKEELGIELKPEQLKYLFMDQRFTEPSKSFKNNQYNDVYVAKVDIDLSKIKIQEEEVSEVRFISISEMKKEIAEGKEDYCGHVIEYIKPFEKINMPKYTAQQIIKKLKARANPKNVEGMARFGISSENTLGINLPTLRQLAKEIGKDHELALELWASGIHEARMLACFVDEADKVSEKQLEKWMADFDSWDICDQVCSNLFDKTPFAWAKAVEWTRRKREFEKRAGFVMMAALSVHDKKAQDRDFEKFFPIIVREAHDERNFVRKAVNWALRQIGKRNENLRQKAIKVGEQILTQNTKSARWIAGDAIRELKKRGR